MQGIETGGALAASTAVAALELVSLLSHVRDLALARRNFQRLLTSAAQDRHGGAVTPSHSIAGSRNSQACWDHAAGDHSASDHGRLSDDCSDASSSVSAAACEGQPQQRVRREHLGVQAGLRRGSVGGGSCRSQRSWASSSRGSRSGRGAAGASPVSAALRTRLLRHLLKGPTIKLLFTAAALRQAAPAYNCTVQQRAAGMLRTWAFCAPDFAKELVVTPYLLCKCVRHADCRMPAGTALCLCTSAT